MSGRVVVWSCGRVAQLRTGVQRLDRWHRARPDQPVDRHLSEVVCGEVAWAVWIHQYRHSTRGVSNPGSRPRKRPVRPSESAGPRIGGAGSASTFARGLEAVRLGGRPLRDGTLERNLTQLERKIQSRQQPLTLMRALSSTSSSWLRVHAWKRLRFESLVRAVCRASRITFLAWLGCVH